MSGEDAIVLSLSSASPLSSSNSLLTHVAVQSLTHTLISQHAGHSILG